MNECAANNGHGPCQDTCVNTEGSFNCTCQNLPGTELASDGKSCQGIDLCLGLVTNIFFSLFPKLDVFMQAGCSTYTLHLAPESSLLISNVFHEKLTKKSCSDLTSLLSVDNGGCSHECYSSYGQAHCTCPSGYTLGDDWKTCRDLDECQTGSNECTEDEECINTDGSYDCRERLRHLGSGDHIDQNLLGMVIL